MSFLLLLLLFAATHAAKFPANWKKCPKTGNEECLKEAVEYVIRDLKDGNPSLGVIPMDPLHFERLVIEQGGSSPVSINLTFYDVDLIGYSQIKVDSVKVDWDGGRIAVSMTHPAKGAIDGDYTISGKVLVLPIVGNGKANITMEGLSTTLILEGQVVERNNKKYFKVSKSLYEIDAQRVYTHLGNLFNGVPGLGENMNKFLNDNWRVILEELKGTIAQAMGEAFKQISNQLFSKVALDDIIAF